MKQQNLIQEQQRDVELSQLTKESISEEQMLKHVHCYYIKSGVFMIKSRPPDAAVSEEWQIIQQAVLSKCCHKEIMSLAYESPMAGHLRVDKTYHKLLSHFFWPKMKRDVTEFCRTCHICQMVGKPNKHIPIASLKPIPDCRESFSEVIIDCISPLPKTTARNKYLLTNMGKATHFPILRLLKIVDSFMKFFTFVGISWLEQSDQGSNFMSGLMQQAMY